MARSGYKYRRVAFIFSLSSISIPRPQTMLCDLPREILENIAIRALSLEMAYLIESNYAGMHIAKVKYSKDTVPRGYMAMAGGQQLTNEQLISSWAFPWMSPFWQKTLLHAALTWEPRNQVAVVNNIEAEIWNEDTWELAFRVRGLTTPFTNDNKMNNGNNNTLSIVNLWLGRSANEERGEFAAKVTGMPWCRHCNSIWNNGDGSDGSDICSHSCDATQVVQKMLNWKRPVNYHFVAGSLANAMGVTDEKVNLQDQYRDKVRLNELLGLGKAVHTFIDQDDNWVIVSETSSKLSKLISNLEKIVRRLAESGVSSRYEIPQQKPPPVGTQYLCTHCCPPYKSAPKTRYERLYVLRMTPLDPEGVNLKTVSGPKEEKPLGSWNDTLLSIKKPEQSSNSRQARIRIK